MCDFQVKIHPDLESVYEVMPKDCLPSEYGGTYSTIPKLTSNLLRFAKMHMSLVYF
jgi:hypothetical protein